MDLKAFCLPIAFGIALTKVHGRDLKADLAAMAPAGQTLRLVYQKGGPPSEETENNGYGNFNTAMNKTAVYAVSSADGVIRKLYPGGDSVGNYHCVNITNDGSRVVFYDFGRNQVVLVKYDGTFIRRFNAPRMYDYWIDPKDKTEWAIVSDNSTVTRINIDKPNDPPVLVTNLMNVGFTINLSDGLGGTLSDDGTKIMVTKEAGDASYPGLLACGTSNFVGNMPGCWGIMRTGSPIQYSQNSGIRLNAVSGHRGPTIIGENGAVAQMVNVSDTLDGWIAKNPGMDASSCSAYPEAGHAVDGLRWLRDRNYFSVIAERCKVGPILWRITDNKWTYIEDNIACTYAGDLDGVIGTFSDGVTGIGATHANPSRPPEGGRSYSADGRRLAKPAGKARPHTGIAIRPSSDGKDAEIGN